MTEKVDTAGEIPGSERPPSEQESPHQFGLTAAMALIVSSIIGVEVFNLPTSLAAYGPITLVSMAHLLAAGALLLRIPVYLAQRRHLTPPEPVSPYR